MTQAQRAPFWLLLILLALSWQACRLNPLDDLRWNTDLLLPIARTELGIYDLVQDSMLQSGADDLLRLVYRDTLAQARLAEFVAFPDTSFTISIKLDTLELKTDTIVQFITLGEVARQMVADGNIFGQLLLNNHGDTLPFVPETPGLSSGVIPIDASAFFNFAELKAGELVLEIENQFPLDLKNVRLQVSNKSLPGPPIVADTFPLIPVQTAVTEVYDLSGKQIESSLEGELVNLDIAAGTNVPIDTNDFIKVTLVAQKLKAKTATAIFPAQTLLDSIRQTIYQFRGEFADLALTKVKVRSGKIRAEAISTVGDSILFNYALVAAENEQGENPAFSLKLPPAPPGGTAQQIKEQDLEGFTIDLSAEGTTVNTLRERIQASLLFSGNLVNLDESDSVSIQFGLFDLEPVYVEGYLGQQRIRFEGSAALDALADLEAEKLQFAEPQVSLSFANSVGVQAQVQVEKLLGIHTPSGESVRLSGAPLLPGPFPIAGPSLPDTNQTLISTLAFDASNSNIQSFINLRLDQVVYDLTLETNPHNGGGSLVNFATSNSALYALVDIELPLVGTVAGLLLRDTAAFDLTQPDLKKIEGGTLRLVLENEFPLEAEVVAEVLDANGQVVQALVENQLIQAGTPGNNGAPGQASTSLLEFRADRDLLETILHEGRQLALRFRMRSQPDDTPVKLYANYRIRADLVAEFTYEVSN